MLQKKICMVGAFATGKTSLVAKYVYSIFSEKYQTTVGVKIDKKLLQVKEQEVNLILWDLYGEDEFQKLRTSYLRGSSGYLLVIDGTRKSTLQTALDLQKRVEDSIGKVPFIVVLNKWDLQDEWELEAESIEAIENQGWIVFKSSAKTGLNVEEIFYTLASKLIEE
ncbi:MAG: GTP-binding protein [Rivularia sp. (in: Bacteria)]|nr:GTP-binding protein [Rivularia sp. MS3]